MLNFCCFSLLLPGVGGVGVGHTPGTSFLSGCCLVPGCGEITCDYFLAHLKFSPTLHLPWEMQMSWQKIAVRFRRGCRMLVRGRTKAQNQYVGRIAP